MPSFKEMAAMTPRINETNQIKRAIMDPDFIPNKTSAPEFNKDAFKASLLKAEVQSNEKYFQPLKPVQLPVQDQLPKKSIMTNINSALSKVGKSLFGGIAPTVLNKRNQKINELTNSKLGSGEIGAVNTTLLGLPETIGKATGGNAFTQAKENHPVSYGVGEFAGYLAPGTGSQKLVGKPLGELAAKKISNKLAAQLIGNAAAGAAVDTTQGLIEGDRGSDLGKRVATGAVIGTGLGLAGAGISKLARFISDIKNPEFTPVSNLGTTTKLNKDPILKPGKYTIKNTALEKAYQDYDEAIRSIQNYTGHYKLTDDEILDASIKLGIDPFKLIDNIDVAENLKISDIGNQAKWKNTVGLGSELKPLQKTSESPALFQSIKNNANTLDNQRFNSKSSFLNTQDTIKTSSNNSVNDFKNGSNLESTFTKITPEFDALDSVNIQNNIPNFGNGSGKFKESKFKTNTMKNSNFLKDSNTQNIINDIKAQYEVKPNEQSIQKAVNELSNNYDSVVNRITNVVALNSAEDTAASGLITRNLRQQAELSNDYSQLKSWLETIQPKVTENAQALQAVKTWKQLSSEGVMFKAQQVVGKVNREGSKTYGKNFKPVELTVDDLKFIDDTMKKVETTKDARTKDLEFGKVTKLISNKIPSTLASKISALQRIQLLLNPKTMVRNTVGNVIMGSLENIKDIPGSLVDKAVSLKTGEKTTLFPSPQGLKTQVKGLATGSKETIQDFRSGVNTSPTGGQYDLNNPAKLEKPQTTFKTPILNKLEKVTNTGLELGDRPFYQATYDEHLRQQMKIAKVNSPTEAMIEKAKSVAEDRTFQNVSAMVKGFQKLQRGLNNIGSGFGIGNEEFGIGNIAIPFTKTPANILDKAIDYSPLGTIKAISQLLSKKTFDQKLFVDRVGRSITGSAAMLLGYDLAKSGLLTGKANKDKDVAALEKQAGKSAYAFKVGDTYRTFDWAQPAAIPLAIGADIYHEGKNRKEASNIAIEAIKSGGQTLFQQSLLQGMQKMFGGTDAVSGVASTIQGIPTQFLPGAVSKTITQLKDPFARDTYDPSAIKSIGKQIQSKIPGLSEKLSARINTLGEPMKTYQTGNNPFNVLINPGTTTKYNPKPAEKLALDIYNATGDKTQFPRVVDNKITYKDKDNKSQTIQLTQTEKQYFQKYVGEETNKIYNEYANNSSFMSLKPEEQVKELQKRLTEIYNDGKSKILKGRDIDVKK